MDRLENLLYLEIIKKFILLKCYKKQVGEYGETAAT